MVSGNSQSRRMFVLSGGLAAAAAAIAPRLAFADAAAVETAIKKLFDGKTFAEGRVKLDVPEIAENGLVVPINVSVESPMTEADHVKAIHVFADGNPLPGVISLKFTPEAGRAAASARMRLAQTQNIICLAEMSDGKIFTAKAQVKVTIGGCGG